MNDNISYNSSFWVDGYFIHNAPAEINDVISSED